MVKMVVFLNIFQGNVVIVRVYFYNYKHIPYIKIIPSHGMYVHAGGGNRGLGGGVVIPLLCCHTHLWPSRLRSIYVLHIHVYIYQTTNNNDLHYFAVFVLFVN